MNFTGSYTKKKCTCLSLELLYDEEEIFINHRRKYTEIERMPLNMIKRDLEPDENKGSLNKESSLHENRTQASQH